MGYFTNEWICLRTLGAVSDCLRIEEFWHLSVWTTNLTAIVTLCPWTRYFLKFLTLFFFSKIGHFIFIFFHQWPLNFWFNDESVWYIHMNTYIYSLQPAGGNSTEFKTLGIMNSFSDSSFGHIWPYPTLKKIRLMNSSYDTCFSCIKWFV